MTTSLHPPHAVLAPQGELDIFSCELLKQRLDEAIDRDCTDLLIDASGIRFTDASGLGSLDRFRRPFESHGGRLRIVNASPTFLRMCQIARYGALVTEDVDARP